MTQETQLSHKQERLFDIAAYNNLTEEERMLYDREQEKRWDNKNALDFKLKQGLQKGLEQGRLEEREKAEAEKLEAARAVKNTGMLSNQQIADSFHLPLDVIEKL